MCSSDLDDRSRRGAAKNRRGLRRRETELSRPAGKFSPLNFNRSSPLVLAHCWFEAGSRFPRAPGQSIHHPASRATGLSCAQQFLPGQGRHGFQVEQRQEINSLEPEFRSRLQPSHVAQASSLLYRGFPTCEAGNFITRTPRWTPRRLEVGDTAGWKPALRRRGRPTSEFALNSRSSAGGPQMPAPSAR